MRPSVVVETSFCVFRLYGRKATRAAIVEQHAEKWPEPVCDVVCPSEEPVVTTETPWFFEENDYTLFAQSKIPGERPLVAHRDPRVIEDIDEAIGVVTPAVSGSIRFIQSVGLSEFRISVGDRTVAVTIEVFPSKLDYLADYYAMIATLAEVDRSLPLRYFGSTFRNLGVSDETEPSTVDWISILRSQFSALEQALRYADAHPLRTLDPEVEVERATRIRSAGGVTRRAIQMGQGQGDWFEVPLVGRIRAWLPALLPFDTLDIAEHRWLKQQLGAVRLEVLRLIMEMEDQAARPRLPRRRLEAAGDVADSSGGLDGMGTKGLVANVDGGAPHGQAADADPEEQRGTEFGASTRAQLDELLALSGGLEHLLRLPIIADASGFQSVSGFTSLRLMRSPGYAQAYQILLVLHLGLSNAGHTAEISTQEIADLYEAWCFVEVVRLLESILGPDAYETVEWRLNQVSLSRQLLKGRASKRVFRLPDGRSLEVGYNYQYSGPTGLQKPDIELVFKKSGRRDIVVVLDAKYRVDRRPEARDDFRITPPPVEAINALHRYRDAVVMKESASAIEELFRPVVRGVALYPLTASDSVSYPESRLRDALAVLGIGAIPFLPGNTDYVASWLCELISLPEDELAWHGPVHSSVGQVSITAALGD